MVAVPGVQAARQTKNRSLSVCLSDESARLPRSCRRHAGSRSPRTAAAAAREDGLPDRTSWIQLLERIASPVLINLAEGRLREMMPIEQAEGADRAKVTHLEAVGRLLNGIAPWLDAAGLTGDEARLQARFRTLAQNGLSHGLDRSSRDALNFSNESQPLVDAAFLGRRSCAPRTRSVTASIASTRSRLIEALHSTRQISPGFNNWLLFSAMVEAALKSLGAPWDCMRVDYAIRQHEQW